MIQAAAVFPPSGPLATQPATMCQIPTDFQPATPQSQPNTSRYRGVTWDKRDGKWRVRISCLGVQHNIGRYFDQEQAARVYDKMAYTLYGNAAITNFGIQAAAASTCRVPQFIHRLRAKLEEWTAQQQQQQQLKTMRAVASTPSLAGGAAGMAGLYSALQASQGLVSNWGVSPSGATLMHPMLANPGPVTPGTSPSLLLTANQAISPGYGLFDQQQRQLLVQQQDGLLYHNIGALGTNWGSGGATPAPGQLLSGSAINTPDRPTEAAVHAFSDQLALKMQAQAAAAAAASAGQHALLPAWHGLQQAPAYAMGGGASAAQQQQQLMMGAASQAPMLVYATSTTPAGPTWPAGLSSALHGKNAPVQAMPPTTQGHLALTTPGSQAPAAGDASGATAQGLLTHQEVAVLLKQQELAALMQQELQGAGTATTAAMPQLFACTAAASAMGAGMGQLQSAAMPLVSADVPGLMVSASPSTAAMAAGNGGPVGGLGWSMSGLNLA